MKTTLHFSASIQASRERVWAQLTGAESYRRWTADFCEGSCFEGSWAEGERIRFLSPGGDGMVGVIAASRPPEHISIRHLGEVKGGVEDTTSDTVKDWAPAYENFTLRATESGTELQISIEVTAPFAAYMNNTYPKALRRLKALCEAAR